MGKIRVVMIILLILVFTSYKWALIGGGYTEFNVNQIVKTVVSEIDMENIKTHVRELSSHGSRFVGYGGYEYASNYIYDYLNKLGLNVWNLTYKIIVPYDYNSTLTIKSPVKKQFRVYALVPNMIQTCKGSYKGELIYVGEGSPKDYTGINVTNKIILMDYNSKFNWMYFLNLGAKAVIFVCPILTVRGESDFKTLESPIKFPRAMISREDAIYLLRLLRKGEKIAAELNLNMFWKEIAIKNIFAFIPGKSQDPNNTIMIACHYDAYSVIPAYTPAADEASSAAALLEFSRILTKYKPYRTVLIGFFSGYAMGMAGVRYFCEDIFFRHWSKPKIINGSKGPTQIFGDQIKIVLSFDFSTDSRSLALVTHGTFYGGFDWTRAGNVESMISYIRRIGEYSSTDYTYKIGGKKYRMFLSILGLDRTGLPSQVNHLSEIFLHVGIFAMTFFTAEASRILWETPCDVYSMVKFDNLKPQIEASYIITSVLLNDPRESTLDNVIRGIMHGHSRNAPLGLALLRGRLSYYNWSKVWYDQHWDKVLSNDEVMIVYVRMIILGTGYKHSFITIANRSGFFEIPGIKPSGWALGAYPYEILAFVINNKTGNIAWGPDYGLYGTRLWPFGPIFILRESAETSGRRLVNVVLFKCGTVVLHDCIDPRTLTTPLVAEIRPLALRLFDSRSRSELTQYGYYISVPPSPLLTQQLISLGIGDPAIGYDTIIFLPPNTPTDIIFKTIKEEIPLGIIRDIEVKGGDYRDLHLTGLRFARETIRLTREKLIHILNEPSLIGSVSIAKKYYLEALQMYNDSINCLKNKNYMEFYPKVYRAWYFARKAYAVTRETYVNIIYTGVTLIVLIIPLALILERIFFEKQELSRIILIIILYALLFSTIYIIHPGLRIAHNTLMASLSIVSLLLIIPVIAFIIIGVLSTLKAIKKKIIGVHFIDVSRLSIMSAAIGVSVGNLKKRPLRTTLTLIVVVLMVTSLTLFTSWTFEDVPSISPLPDEYKPLYKGLLIKTAGEESRLSPTLIEYMLQYAGENSIVAPRVWLPSAARGGGFYAYSDKSGNTVFVKAIIGLTYKEPLPFQETLKYNIWFKRGDIYKAIITDDIAEELNITFGDKIYVAGLSLVVTDILYTDIFSTFKDIDQSFITPRDPNAPPGAPIPTKDHFIIIPYDLAIRIGGIVTSLAIYNPNSTKILEKAKEISEQLTYLETYYSDGDKSYLITWIRGYQLMGLAELMTPLIITVLILLNTMINAVYERLREIKIYSALGLSPLHVAVMMFSEGFIYAIMGATIGYIVSLSIGCVVTLMFPGTYLVNYSSPYPLIAIFLSMISVILAGIYPSLKASTLVTPSLRRKWKIPTKPRGNEWYIPLPFALTNVEEVCGIMSFLKEYFENVVSEKFKIEETPKIDREEAGVICLNMMVRLPPYDAGITEKVKVIASSNKENKFGFGVHAILKTGKLYLWESSHKNFVDIIRKQLLMWRGLRSIDRRKYIRKAKEIMGM